MRNRPTVQIDPDGHYVLGANGAEMEAEYVANMEAELEAAQQQQQQPPAPAPQPPPTPTPTPAPAQPPPTPEKTEDKKLVGPAEQIALRAHNQRCPDCPCEVNPLPTADTPSVGPHIPHSTGHWDLDQPDFPVWVDDDGPATGSDYELPHTEKALPKGKERWKDPEEERRDPNGEGPPPLEFSFVFGSVAPLVSNARIVRKVAEMAVVAEVGSEGQTGEPDRAPYGSSGI